MNQFTVSKIIPYDYSYVNGFFAKPCDIYSISGTLMRKNANSLNGLEKGVYIIDGKTVFVK